MFDLNRSYFNDLREKPVAAGATIAEEGTVLVYAADGLGGVAVQPCTTGAAQPVAGFAICDAMKVATETVVEVVTVPVAGGAVTLKNATIINASALAIPSGASAHNPMTNDGVGPGAPADGHYTLSVAGVITFNVAQALQTVTLTYRYNLTLEQITTKYHQRSVNNTAQDYFSSVSVGTLEGEIFTSMYDTAVVYAINGLVFLAASGRLSSAAGGSANAIGFVTQLPSVNDGLLGVKYHLPIVS